MEQPQKPYAGTPDKQIRATYSNSTIRVYQAFNSVIASNAIRYGTFQPPHFKMERMTWIKPSFLWTMYRSGWGLKDPNQSNILAIDITRKGFLWALSNASLSNHLVSMTKEERRKKNAKYPVRVQWDPERNIFLERLQHRSIQIGLKEDAVVRYVSEWIVHIEDITKKCTEIYQHIQAKQLAEAKNLLPIEKPFELDENLKQAIGM